MHFLIQPLANKSSWTEIVKHGRQLSRIFCLFIHLFFFLLNFFPPRYRDNIFDKPLLTWNSPDLKNVIDCAANECWLSNLDELAFAKVKPCQNFDMLFSTFSDLSKFLGSLVWQKNLRALFANFQCGDGENEMLSDNFWLQTFASFGSYAVLIGRYDR